MDLVSVIVPVYKGKDYLEDHAFKIFDQTYKNIEVIFLDDCSPDNSYDMLLKFKESHPDKDITLYRNEKNTGPGPLRNRGLEMAKGKYVWFLDADDDPDVTWIEKMYNKAEQEQADFVMCGYKQIENKKSDDGSCKKEVTDEFIKKEFLDHEHDINYINLHAVRILPSPWSKLIRRSFMIEHGIRFPNIRFGDDQSCSINLTLLANKIGFVNELLYKYELQPNSLTYGKYFECKFEQTFYLFNLFENLQLPQDVLENNKLLWFHEQLVPHIHHTFANNAQLKDNVFYDVLDFFKEQGFLKEDGSFKLAAKYPLYKFIPKCGNNMLRNKLKAQYEIGASIKRINSYLESIKA